MSFLRNLGKSFVRSAVNQVGRDGGKVISNKVYGDGHTTPINIVEEVPKVPEEYMSYEKIPEYNFFKYMLAIFITVVFLPIGSFIVFYGYFKHRDITMINVNEVNYLENRISDKRYGCGYRLGDPIKQLTKRSIRANEQQIKDSKKKSEIYLTISLLGIIFYIIGIISL